MAVDHEAGSEKVQLEDPIIPLSVIENTSAALAEWGPSTSISNEEYASHVNELLWRLQEVDGRLTTLVEWTQTLLDRWKEEASFGGIGARAVLEATLQKMAELGFIEGESENSVPPPPFRSA